MKQASKQTGNNGPTNALKSSPKLNTDTCGKPLNTEDCWNAANNSRPKRKFHADRQTDYSTKKAPTEETNNQ